MFCELVPCNIVSNFSSWINVQPSNIIREAFKTEKRWKLGHWLGAIGESLTNHVCVPTLKTCVKMAWNTLWISKNGLILLIWVPTYVGWRGTLVIWDNVPTFTVHLVLKASIITSVVHDRTAAVAPSLGNKKQEGNCISPKVLEITVRLVWNYLLQDWW